MTTDTHAEELAEIRNILYNTKDVTEYINCSVKECELLKEEVNIRRNIKHEKPCIY